MTSLSEVDFERVQEQLTVRRLRIMQMFYSALVFSIMVLLVFFLFFFAMSSDMMLMEVDFNSSVTVTATVIWIMAAVGIIGGFLVYRLRLGPRQLSYYASEPMREGGAPLTDPVEKLLMLVQTAVISRGVLFTVPALVSAVICLYWIAIGSLRGHPERLAHLIPAFTQLAFLSVFWPTRERVLNTVREILGKG